MHQHCPIHSHTHRILACHFGLILIICMSLLTALPFKLEAKEIRLVAKADSFGHGESLFVNANDKTLNVGGKTVPAEVASFALNTERKTLEYRIADWAGDAGAVIFIHGFAPPGWEAGIIQRIEPTPEKTGTLHFSDNELKNIQAGLTYVSLHSKTFPGGVLRAQIRNPDPLPTDFPIDAEVTRGDGRCFAKLTVFGVVEEVELEMEAAQVTILRLPPGDSNANGLRDVQLSADIEVGGGYAPGIGPIEIQMLGPSPGLVEARQKGTDFPADMTLRLHKRYITPIGTFVGEEEPFKADNINQFPPFGSHLYPQVEKVRLLDEKTGKHVGYIHLGTVVQISHIDPHDFPKDKVAPRVLLRPIPKYYKDIKKGDNGQK